MKFAGVACAVALTVAGCSPESARFGDYPNSNPYGSNSRSSRGYAPYPSASSASYSPPRPSSPTTAYAPSRAYSAPPTPYASSSSFQSEPLEEPAAPSYDSSPSAYGGYGPSSHGASPPPYGPPPSSYPASSYASSPPYSPPAQAGPPQVPRPYGSSTPPATAMQYQPLEGGTGVPPRPVPSPLPPHDAAMLPAPPLSAPRPEPARAEPPVRPEPPPQRLAALPSGNATTAYATAPRAAQHPPGTAAVPAVARVPAAVPVAVPEAAPPKSATAGKGEAVAAAPAVTTSGQTLLPVPPVHTVTHGDTLSRVAQRFGVSAREVAVANGLAPDAPLRVGSRLTIPVKTPVAARGQKVPDAHAPEPAPARPAPGTAIVATAQVVTPVEPPGPGFRWPVRGRIVNNFGSRVNGSVNDGIDLAVPEGTLVRAADDGVVAYASNELKGYGNLVLVRHPNGFVTAYANGSEFLVKRNDQVRKGQVIMKSGQTGSVSAPQLHFEIRKNSAPVDPTQYLPADKSASAPL